MDTLDSIGKKFPRIAIIGTGGGNDIYSALAVCTFLIQQGCKVDLFGVLSPGAYHTYNSNSQEKVIQEITPDILRYLGYKIPKKISFDDVALPKLIQQKNRDIEKMYHLSTRFGTEKLLNEFESLANKNGYDLVLGVDVGGDIFSRHDKDHQVLSPMMDLTLLHLLGNTTRKSLLLEFGIGTDGEIQDIEGVLKDLHTHQDILEEDTLPHGSIIEKSLHHIHNFIIKEKLRKGNTLPRTCETMYANTSLHKTHNISQKIFTQDRNIQRPVFLDKAFFRKYYLIDPKKLYERRKETTAVSYSNIIEHYMYLKNLNPSRKTEIDVLPIRSGDNYTTPDIGVGLSTLLLQPIPDFSLEDREQILDIGTQHILSGEIDQALIASHDINNITTKGLSYKDINETHLLISKK